MDLFGYVFENLVLRDLIVYAQAHNARILHYADDTGLEADAVYQTADGRYALIEIKTGVNRKPSPLIVICATALMRCTTDKGVKIIPLGCLKD